MVWTSMVCWCVCVRARACVCITLEIDSVTVCTSVYGKYCVMDMHQCYLYLKLSLVFVVSYSSSFCLVKRNSLSVMYTRRLWRGSALEKLPMVRAGNTQCCVCAV